MPSPKTAAQPSAVIFDVGKVLYGWDPDSFLSRQIPDDAARLKFIQDVDFAFPRCRYSKVVDKACTINSSGVGSCLKRDMTHD